jgi:ribosomal protein S18 acetylase RimI-like enzyme
MSAGEGSAKAGGVTVRRAQERDLGHLVDLFCALGDAGTAADRRYQLRNDARATAERIIRERWLGSDQSYTAWVAVGDGNELVGYIATRMTEPHMVLEEPSTLIITDTFVTATHRRRGVGRALVGAVFEHARLDGVTAIDVGTLALDTQAVAFWRGLGFGDWRVLLRHEA